ncbi:hypothetical protein L1887_47810 [Cichorium endivia]|nr:hypothetical protein L1887_47810 [Cichorium endivia]
MPRSAATKRRSQIQPARRRSSFGQTCARCMGGLRAQPGKQAGRVELSSGMTGRSRRCAPHAQSRRREEPRHGACGIMVLEQHMGTTTRRAEELKEGLRAAAAAEIPQIGSKVWVYSWRVFSGHRVGIEPSTPKAIQSPPGPQCARTPGALESIARAIWTHEG